MYGGNHNHHGGGGLRLLIQRFLCSYRALVAIFVVFLFTIFLYYYNESLSLLKTREIEGNRCQQKLDSISAQLQVVYEHKSRLEKALTGDREACNKKMDDMSKSLKTTKDDYDKTQTELKTLKKTQTDLEKQVTDLKSEKKESEKTVSKAGIDAAKAKEAYEKEVEVQRDENSKLNGHVNQLQTALNKSFDQILSLQQQLDQQRHQLAYLQQQQSAALREPLPNQQRQADIPGAAQQAILVSPHLNQGIQQPAPVGQVPQVNGALPPQPQLPAVQPQPEQVAVPMAEHQQQQLLAQRQVPLQQQQQQVGQAGAQAPVLQHPLGEDQQQLMMARPNNAGAAFPPGAPPVVQAPPPAPFADTKGQPLQQQAPPPAPLNNSVVVPPPAPAAGKSAKGL